MDTFDLKKFLKESKAIENLNPTIKSLNENHSLKDKIREMIVAELEGKDLEDATKTAEQNPKDKKPKKDLPSADLALHMAGVKETTNPEDPYETNPDDDLDDDEKSYYSHFQDLVLDPNEPEDELEEAKKKKDEETEEVEDVDVTDTEDISLDDIPTTEETPEPSVGGGLEDITAMKGTEGDLMDHLMKAFQIAKGMNNEKLETQVGNTLKFFVSEYIGGGQD